MERKKNSVKTIKTRYTNFEKNESFYITDKMSQDKLFQSRMVWGRKATETIQICKSICLTLNSWRFFVQGTNIFLVLHLFQNIKLHKNVVIVIFLRWVSNKSHFSSFAPVAL